MVATISLVIGEKLKLFYICPGFRAAFSLVFGPLTQFSGLLAKARIVH